MCIWNLKTLIILYFTIISGQNWEGYSIFICRVPPVPPLKCHERGGQKISGPKKMSWGGGRRVWPTKNITRGCFLAPTKMSWGGPLTTHQKCPRGVLFGENLANKTTVSRWRLHAGPPFCLFWSTSAASGTYNIHRIWVIYCSFYLNIIKYSYWYNNLALKLNKTE